VIPYPDWNKLIADMPWFERKLNEKLSRVIGLKRRWDYFTSWEESNDCPQYVHLMTWCVENNLSEENMSKAFGHIQEQSEELENWLHGLNSKSMPSSEYLLLAGPVYECILS
jgi:hypothetical protein